MIQYQTSPFWLTLPLSTNTRGVDLYREEFLMLLLAIKTLCACLADVLYLSALDSVTSLQ